jgi:hypothetical protein
MHAVLVTFTTSVPAEALEPAMLDYADALGSVDGLLTKAWLQDGDTLGGFYVFRDAEAARAYLDGPIFRGIRINPVFTGLRVREFGLIDHLGARTGMPVPIA